MMLTLTTMCSSMTTHAAELDLHLPTIVSHSGESKPTHQRRGPHGTARVLVDGVRHYDGVLMRQEVRFASTLHPSQLHAIREGWGFVPRLQPQVAIVCGAAALSALSL
jgi:hypothetical protein